MNRVRVSRGAEVATVTFTLNVQDADRPAESLAVHCTDVVPTPKSDPDCRVHETCTGAAPPEVAGCGEVTATWPPAGAVAVWPGGHVMVNDVLGCGCG
jgi:hypothetical protein